MRDAGVVGACLRTVWHALVEGVAAVPRDITHADIPSLHCGMDANGREVHASPNDQLRSLRDSVPHMRTSWCGAVDQLAETLVRRNHR